MSIEVHELSPQRKPVLTFTAPPPGSARGVEALFYAAEYGWHVFPLKPRLKTPLTDHGVKDATTDPVVIAAWWERWPTANIGVATGIASGFFVVDADRREIGARVIDGIGNLETLIALHGDDWPDTLSQETGNGLQFFFAMPEDGTDVRNSASVLAPGVDIRGTGGYVVLPSSIHPTGKAYRWRTPAPTPPAPEWLLQKKKKEGEPQQDSGEVNGINGTVTPMPAVTIRRSGLTKREQRAVKYVDSAVYKETQKLERATEGTRNDVLNSVTFALARYVGSGFLDEEVVTDTLTEIALKIGLTEKEIAATINSAMKKGKANPRDPMAEIIGEAEKPKSKKLAKPATSAKVPPIPETAPEPPPYTNGHTTTAEQAHPDDAIFDEADQPPETGEGPEPADGPPGPEPSPHPGPGKGNSREPPGDDGSTLELINPATFQGLPVPEREWLVPDWIPIGVVTGLYGDGGLGKSLLCQQLLTAVALGQPWVGLPVKTVKAIAMFCEDASDELHRRQASINQLYRCDFNALGEHVRWLPRLGYDNILMDFDGAHGNLTPLFSKVLDEALRFGARLVVIDSAADTFGGNENDRSQVRQFVQRVGGYIAQAIGGAVVICAHPSRAGLQSGSGDSGSTGWNNAFRSRLYLSAPEAETGEPAVDPNARILARKKANYAAREDQIKMRWRDGAFIRTDIAQSGIIGAIKRRSAETVFLAILDRLTREDRPVSPKPRAGNYAPKIFCGQPDREDFKVADFERAMQTLFFQKAIVVLSYGRSGDQRERVIRAKPEVADGC